LANGKIARPEVINIVRGDHPQKCPAIEMGTKIRGIRNRISFRLKREAVGAVAMRIYKYSHP
jgi:hypothetical protein